MIDQGFLKSHFLGRDGFIWWIGQIVDKTKWEGNIPGSRTSNTGGHAGFDQRYKVRIMGYHTEDPEKLSDDDLVQYNLAIWRTTVKGSVEYQYVTRLCNALQK